jgi:DNA processing protein
MSIDDRLARVALSHIFEPGDQHLVRLASQLGAVRLYRELLTGQHNTAQIDIEARLRRIDPERILEAGRRRGLRYVIPGDDEWPDQLEPLDHVVALYDRTGVPMGLWVRGPLRLDTLAKSVAIVGSRTATTYGSDAAAHIAAEVGRAGYAVISGAAYGIDFAAHRGALAVGAPTVAVLACGADRIYPPRHDRLFEILANEGAIVSEVGPGLPPTRLRFLTRNRIIAGLGRGTVIVEAARRSGALNTANWTARLSRPVMGVPGAVTSASSEGVHRLLRGGSATLVTSGVEVLEMVAPVGEYLPIEEPAPERPRDRLTLREQRVLDAVPVGAAAAVDSIAHSAGMGLIAVQSALTALHDRGLVSFAGNGWRLTPDALRSA